MDILNAVAFGLVVSSQFLAVIAVSRMPCAGFDEWSAVNAAHASQIAQSTYILAASGTCTRAGTAKANYAASA